MENETWMDANKAMELGFADGILQREDTLDALSHDKHGSNATKNMQKPPVMFSQKKIDAALVNRLAAKDAASTVSAKPLYERLEKLRA